MRYADRLLKQRNYWKALDQEADQLAARVAEATRLADEAREAEQKAYTVLKRMILDGPQPGEQE